MRILAPGWALIDERHVVVLVRGPLGSWRWRDAALIDRHTGAIYPLVVGIGRETVARVLEGA